MTTHRFSRGKRIRWEDAVDEIGIRHEGNIFSLRNMTTNEEIAVEIRTSTNALFADTLSFIVPQDSVKPLAAQHIDLSSYSDRQVR